MTVISRSFAVAEREISQWSVVVARVGDSSESGKPGVRVRVRGARTPADQKGKVSSAMSSSSLATHAA